MKICPKCKKQYESGSFCENCENEDGSPVRLEEDKISCPQCGKKYDKGTKFCSDCGVRLTAGGSGGASGLSLGDKNVIAGDVNNSVTTTNNTYVTNTDETKKTAKCHICGSVVQRINGYDCPDCGEFTCEECFDKAAHVCKNCVNVNKKNNEQQYRMKVVEYLSNDGKIDAQEYSLLEELAVKLGISSVRANEIQNEVRNNSEAMELTTFEKMNFDKAEKLFYGEGKTEEAFNLIEQIYNNHKTDEKVLSLYLQVLADTDDAKAKRVIESLQFDSLSAYITAVEIAVKEKDLNTAEKKLQRAEKMWPDSVILKCHRILFIIALYDYSKEIKWLEKAAELMQSTGNAHSKIELSWQMKMKSMVNEVQGKSSLNFDMNFCLQNQLYYAFMQKNLLLSKEEIRRQEEAKRLKEERQREETRRREEERRQEEERQREEAKRREEERRQEEERRREEARRREEERRQEEERQREETRRREEERRQEEERQQEEARRLEEERRQEEEWNKEKSGLMVYVEGGKLILGSLFNGGEHEVTLDSFYISKYEVTQKFYESVMGENPSKFKGRNRPVELVSWYDALEFCNKLSLEEGLTPCYKIDKSKKDYVKWSARCNFKANGYRLPTEAEWEYAARGGQKTQNTEYAGSNNIGEVAWYDGNSEKETHDVGKKAPNELGLYDMSGNVLEWCWDWYCGTKKLHGGKNPTGVSSGTERVCHGGGYYYPANWCCVDYENGWPPFYAGEGFRVCRNAN